MRPLAALLVALWLSAGCRHHVAATVPSPPSGPTRWILDPDAHDSDQFCVPSPNQPGTATSDVFPLRCTSVEEIRRHVRELRSLHE